MSDGPLSDAQAAEIQAAVRAELAGRFDRTQAAAAETAGQQRMGMSMSADDEARTIIEEVRRQLQAVPPETPIERRLGDTYEGRAQWISFATMIVGAAGALVAGWAGQDPTPFYALMGGGGVSQLSHAALGAARQLAKGQAA